RQAACLAKWGGREPELTALVLAQAKGQSAELTRFEYQAAIQAGRIGRLLAREKQAQTGTKTPTPPSSALNHLAADLVVLRGRLRALGVADPFSTKALEN